ncbi:integrase [Tsukamurella tyrosinosolvens]|nr:tyrosine-type recombinase/integrase [Tsukamurella tyrosinosolvens]KXO99065.1 integrase [Tsukamurella tyrosinosolvens]
MLVPAQIVPGPVPDLPIALRERIARAAGRAHAPGTVRAYDSAWRRFTEWCAREKYQALPAAPAVVAAYLVDAADTLEPDGTRTYATSTLTKWVAAIGDRHRRAGIAEPPTNTEIVKATLGGIRREYADAGDRPRNARAPLLTDDIVTIISAAREQVEGWAADVFERRDSAVLLIGFAGAFRREELANFTGRDVQLHPLDGLHLYKSRSKTDQEGLGRRHAVPRTQDPRNCPPCAYTRWAEIVEAADAGGRTAVIRTASSALPFGELHVCRGAHPRIGPRRALFRPIGQNGLVAARGLSEASIHAIVCRRALGAGYSPELVERLGAHSLRAGFVTQAFRNGADAHAIMRQTDHRSAAMVERYAREEAPLIGNAVTSLGL